MLSHTWRRRLITAGHGTGRIVIVVLAVNAALNGIHLLWQVIVPPAPPPIAGTARTMINQADLVKAFAVDCVTGWLTAATTQHPDLSRCFPHSDNLSLPTTPALIVTAPQAQATALGPNHQNITTYGVIVAVTEQPYPSATPVRAYYQISVSVYAGAGPRALATPARVDPPPPGVDVELGYPQTIPTTSRLGSMVAGFVTCYVTGAPGLERYTTTDSGLSPLHAYSAATVTGIRAAADPPDAPPDNAELHVLVTVSARSPAYVPYDLSYPLTVRAAAGSWSVAAIDPVPVLSDAALTEEK